VRCGKAGQSDRAQESSKATSPLEYQVYKTQVEPIFLKRRGEHTRCYACHSQNASAFRLQRLLLGRTSWTEDQSRLNFESVTGLVEPGDLALSPLMRHPLAPEGGGDSFDSGGRQFESQNDPDWKTIAAWARIVKVGS